MEDILVVIDGPAGAGKTTISRKLSQRLGFRYVDTGALYRSIALYMVESGIDVLDKDGIIKGLESIEIKLSEQGDIILNGEIVSDKIRQPEISMAASKVSALKEVRSFLFEIQRNIGADKRAVFEGRDMGTIVFPDADIKFFLTASPKIRAERRFLEIKDKTDQRFEDVFEDMKKRDKADMERENAPLKQAEDAILIDSSEMSLEDVVDKMVFAAKNKKMV